VIGHSGKRATPSTLSPGKRALIIGAFAVGTAGFVLFGLLPMIADGLADLCPRQDRLHDPANGCSVQDSLSRTFLRVTIAHLSQEGDLVSGGEH